MERFGSPAINAGAAGAQILYNSPRDGALPSPITIDGVLPEAELVRDKTLGQVIPTIRVPDEHNTVILISKGYTSCLSAGLSTNNLDCATRFVDAFISARRMSGHNWISSSSCRTLAALGSLEMASRKALRTRYVFANLKDWTVLWTVQA